MLGPAPVRRIGGLVVLYLNVHALPPEKSKIFVDGMREQLFGSLEERLKEQGYEVIVIPTRDRPTQLEVVVL